MTSKSKGRNSILSFVAMVFLLYFIVLPLVIAVLMDYFGTVGEIITNIIDLIPFGKPYYEFAVQFVNSLGGQIVSYIDMTEDMSVGYLFRELAKGLFTVIIFEALNWGSCILFGFLDENGRINPRGFWNRGKYLLISLVNALFSACLAPLPLNYIFSNLHILGTIWANIVSFLLSAILVGGGIAFFMFLFGLNIGMAITYVFLKFFLIGACRISISYLAILVTLICWQNGLFFLSASGASALFVIGFMLGGLEMIIKGAFEI